MRDAVAGEEQIKQAQTKYLAKSAGMIEAEKQGDTTGEIYKSLSKSSSSIHYGFRIHYAR